MKLTVKDTKGNNQGELEVKFALVEDGKGTQAVHDAVVAYQAAQRMGTACTKNVGEVAGTEQEALAAEGHGPRARRFVPVPAVARRRRGLRAEAP